MCLDGEVRLVAGAIWKEGRVEVCRNNTWMAVCNENFDSAAAKVVCHQLGLSSDCKCVSAIMLVYTAYNNVIIICNKAVIYLLWYLIVHVSVCKLLDVWPSPAGDLVLQALAC